MLTLYCGVGSVLGNFLVVYPDISCPLLCVNLSVQYWLWEPGLPWDHSVVTPVNCKSQSYLLSIVT